MSKFLSKFNKAKVTKEILESEQQWVVSKNVIYGTNNIRLDCVTYVEY